MTRTITFELSRQELLDLRDDGALPIMPTFFFRVQGLPVGVDEGASAGWVAGSCG